MALKKLGHKTLNLLSVLCLVIAILSVIFGLLWVGYISTVGCLVSFLLHEGKKERQVLREIEELIGEPVEVLVSTDGFQKASTEYVAFAQHYVVSKEHEGKRHSVIIRKLHK